MGGGNGSVHSSYSGFSAPPVEKSPVKIFVTISDLILLLVSYISNLLFNLKHAKIKFLISNMVGF